MADKRERYTMSRRGVSFLGMAMLAAALLLPQIADAQNYPNRPVRLILPFGAGGVADVTARLVTEKLGEKLGQRFVIENMAGAGGINAARAVLSAPADGYTLALLSNGTASWNGGPPEDTRSHPHTLTQHFSSRVIRSISVRNGSWSRPSDALTRPM